MSLAPALDLRPPGDAPVTAPCSIEAEQALLGAILYDNAAFEIVSDRLMPAHFYEPFHGRLYTEIARRIHGGHLADPTLVVERFGRDEAFADLGGVRYLADLVDRAPPSARAADYALVIYDLAIRRELIRIAGDVAKGAQDPTAEESATDQVEAAEAQLFALAENGGQPKGLRTIDGYVENALVMANEAFMRDGGISGISTGLADLDRMLGGLHPTDLIILASRPSMGKSALACNIALNVGRRYAWEPQPDGSRKTVSGGVVGFFSLEMSGEQLSMRMMADLSGISGDRVRKGDINATEFARLRDAGAELNGFPIHIDDTGGLSIARLATRARRMKRRHGLDLVIVDYLQLASVDGRRKDGNRVQEVTEITMGLKALAKDLNVPVVALSQLSRRVEEREDKKPQLSDLRESGSIEQDADVVMFLYREAYYLERTEPKEGTEEHLAWQEKMEAVRYLAEAYIGKQRHGPIGTVRLHFDPDTTKFSNLARERDYGHVRQPYAENA